MTVRFPAVDLRSLRLRVRVLLVVLGGAATGLSWQPYGLWPLLLLGIPALTVAVRGVRLRRAFWLGGVFALVMLTLTLGWIHVLGLPIALALIAFMALYYALMSVGLRLVSRLPGWPIWSACCWVLCEYVFSRVPLGGFGWARIAYAAVDTPLAGFLPVLGVAGLSFLVALVPHLLIWALLPDPDRNNATPPARAPRALAVGIGASIVICLTGLGLTRFQVEPLDPGQGSVNVGIVQGNVPGRGIDALGRARSVTYNHLSETINLMTRSRLGQTPVPDFILWPENSTDIDPIQDAQTRATVQSAVDIADRPIFVGAVTEGPGPDERQTTGIWWDPVNGPGVEYHKRNLVPFGEWIPFRAQLLPLIPMLQMVGAQSVPGTTPGALTVGLTDGRTITVGDVICFELAYDHTIADAVRAGAQVMTVQSNNATYGGTGQIDQQFAITRARAMETRREIAVATTNALSGYIDRDGHVVYRTQQFTAASTTVTMPLRQALTPALTTGPWVDRLLALAGLMSILAGAVAGMRRHPELATVTSTGSPGEPAEDRVVLVGHTGQTDIGEPTATAQQPSGATRPDESKRGSSL